MKKLTLVLSVTMLAFVAMSVVAERALASHLVDSAVLTDDDCNAAEASTCVDNLIAQMIIFQSLFGRIKVFGVAANNIQTGDFSLLYTSCDCSGAPGPNVPLGAWVDVDDGLVGTFEIKTRARLRDFCSVSIRRNSELLVCGVLD
ncbi:hypothetical protein MYX76_11295 [Desulfobacterota bacterium AH_259_B03_O07]|nr:hypothetical protein [Desulfobacterota bacterium AH_259_B03_O07]